VRACVCKQQTEKNSTENCCGISGRTYLVQCTGASKYDVRVFHLDNTLSKTDNIGADADSAARYETHGDYIIVGTRRFTGNEARTT